MSNTKTKGDVAEAKVLADLVQKEYKILIPFGEDCKFDVVAYKGNKFTKIQCKYDGGRNEGVISVKCSSTNNWNVHKYTPTEIDCIAVYHQPTDKCYYIPSSLLGKNGRDELWLRILPTKNKQSKGIVWAKDFMEIK